MIVFVYFIHNSIALFDKEPEISEEIFQEFLGKVSVESTEEEFDSSLPDEFPQKGKVVSINGMEGRFIVL